MLGYAMYQNNSVVIVKIYDTGAAAGTCVIRYSNGRTEYVDYRNLTVLSWELVA